MRHETKSLNVYTTFHRLSQGLSPTIQSGEISLSEGSGMKRYKYLEHVADLYIAAYGRSLKEAFENAAYAMFDSMTDIEKVEPTTKDRIQIEAEDEVALLHDWLLNLLIKFEIETMLFSKFDVKQITKLRGRYTLHADVAGEVLNQKKHPSKVDVKAVTYHQMFVNENNGRVELRFILDI